MNPPPPHDDVQALPVTPQSSPEAVRDVQGRLVTAGADLTVDGVFGPATAAALRAFQAGRGLVESAHCDDATWAALVEAGFGLGDRVLYLSRPMARGDDIAELQRRLGGLGFDAGHVDGIFGPDTDAALRDFQRNSGLTVDGVCGPATLDCLARLGSRIDRPATVAGVRARQRLRDAPRDLHQRRLVVTHAGGVDAIAHALARALGDAGAEAVVIQHRDPSAVAAQANEFAAELVIDLEVGDGPCWCAYYQSGDFWSPGGRRLAELLTPALQGLGLQSAGPRGMRLTTLRETRMSAVVVHVGPASVAVTDAGAITEACATAVMAWARQPLDPEA
jgi:N-acetylmuramoyl-L-alanine amidase